MNYQNKRHIVDDRLLVENPRDFPDMETVETPDYHTIKPGFSQREIVERPKVDFESRRREVSVNMIKENNQKLLQDKEKIKRYYEGYIEELEKENKRLKEVEKEYEVLSQKKRELILEIEELNQRLELLRGQGGSDPQMVEDLKKRISSLNSEKLELLKLIDLNKREITTLNEKIIKVQNDFPDKERLLQQIRELKVQLNNTQRQVVTREKVVYKEVPQRVERVVERKQYHCVMMLGQECNGNYHQQCNCWQKQTVKQTVPIKQSIIKETVPIKQSIIKETVPVRKSTITVQRSIPRERVVSRVEYGLEQRPIVRSNRSRSRKRYVMDLVHNRQRFLENSELQWEKSLVLDYQKLIRN